MSDEDRAGARAFLLFLLIGLAALSAYYRFTNPDMTSTRYIITYWPIYLAACILLIAYFFLRRTRGPK